MEKVALSRKEMDRLLKDASAGTPESPGRRTVARTDYIRKRRKLSGVFFETALPNEYLVRIGTRSVKPILGGRSFRLFRKFLRVPASVQTLSFATDNANLNYQGIGIDGYATWRIDPAHPDVAITTLDFFDEDDPMRDTNEKLTTICVEAVRHVIANMTINDALKKKDEIGENLKEQLRKFENRWGIIFDQVGIENVRIMSEKLFEDLQSEYRDQLRLNVATARIQTDRQIAGAENATRELTETERMTTERKLSLAKTENESSVKRVQLTKAQEVYEEERAIKEERFRRESEFKREQQEREHQVLQQQQELDSQLQQTQQSDEYKTKIQEQELLAELQGLQERVLRSELDIETIRTAITGQQLEPIRARRFIEQSFTQEQLSHEVVEALPKIYAALEIDNYSVMNTGSGGDITPIGKILQEVIGLLKANGLGHLLGSAGIAAGGGAGARSNSGSGGDHGADDVGTLEEV